MKNLSVLSLIATGFFLLAFNNSTIAQISQGGIPPSFLYPTINEDIEVLDYRGPDMEQINKEDTENRDLGYPEPYRVGLAIPVNISIEDAGTWTSLPDGGKIWRITLVSEGALALGVYYDDFWIPSGGELYLYNDGRDHVIGAFTEENNNAECVFANQLIEGDKVTLEYYQPADQEIMPNLSISEIAYNYRGIQFEYSNRGGSAWCMINISCSPEGDDWQDEKQGVVKQYMKIGWGYYLCSGSLLNNTSLDKTPYVLTAWHCGEGATASDMNQWVFYYNYESATCSGNWGPSTNSQTGCSKRAEGSYETGSDFLLLELNQMVPLSYNPYFNGWDRRNLPADSGVSIHHPQGDIKKISTFDSPATSSQWNNNGVLSHWRVWWAETFHGTSITEGGSSGSPLFNQDGRVIGDLGGGPPDDCNSPLYSLYGKLSFSWDQMGTGPSQRLEPWLDPEGSGVETWDGIYEPSAPAPDFAADQTAIQTGSSVTFTDMTTSNPLEWEWTFEGGDPATHAGKEPPPVQYDTPGNYTVTLTSTNTIGSSTKDSIEMISVGVPAANFSADNTYMMNGDTSNFTDESLGDPVEWYWEFPGADPETSTTQNPENIIFTETGNYNVMLLATNAYGSDTIIKENFITVGGPYAEFTVDQTNIVSGESVNFTDLSINEPTSWSWKFIGGSPGSHNGQTPPPIFYNSPGNYSVKLTVSNELGSHFMNKVSYIQVGTIGIGEDNDDYNQVSVYPNPTSGKVSIYVKDASIVIQKIKVTNTHGEQIYTTEPARSGNKFEIDLSDQPNGVYFLSVKTSETLFNKKVYLMQ